MNNDCYLVRRRGATLPRQSKISRTSKCPMNFIYPLSWMCLNAPAEVLFKRLLVKSLTVHCIGKLVYEDLGGNIYVSDFISFIKVDGEWGRQNTFFSSCTFYFYFLEYSKNIFLQFSLNIESSLFGRFMQCVLINFVPISLAPSIWRRFLIFLESWVFPRRCVS